MLDLDSDIHVAVRSFKMCYSSTTELSVRCIKLPISLICTDDNTEKNNCRSGRNEHAFGKAAVRRDGVCRRKMPASVLPIKLINENQKHRHGLACRFYFGFLCVSG